MKKLRNLLGLIISFTFTLNLYSSQIDPYWYLLPEDQNYQMKSNGLNPSKEESNNLNSISDTLDRFILTHLNSFEELAETRSNKRNGDWHLSGFQTSLGLGLEGSIGLLSWGGTQTIQIDWGKKGTNYTDEDNGNLENYFTFNQETTKVEMTKQIQPLIKSLILSKKVKSETLLRKEFHKVVDQFYELSKAVNIQKRGGWRPQKLRLDFAINGSGTITPVFVKAGGEVRVRLEWIKVGGNQMEEIREEDSKDKVNQSLKFLLEDLSNEITAVTYNSMGLLDFMLGQIEVGIGISAGGGVAGIVDLEGSVTPSVFFTKENFSYLEPYNFNKNNQDREINLIVKNEDTDFNFAKENKIQFEKGSDLSVFKLNRNRVRRGIKKALKFSNLFIRKLEKEKYSKNNWGVRRLKSMYTFSLTGDVGVVRLKSRPHFAFYFYNTNSFKN